MDPSRVFELYNQTGGILTCNSITNKCSVESTNLVCCLDISIPHLQKLINDLPKDKIEPIFETPATRTYEIGGYKIVRENKRIQTGILKAQYNEIFGMVLHPQAIGIKINTLNK